MCVCVRVIVCTVGERCVFSVMNGADCMRPTEGTRL